MAGNMNSFDDTEDFKK